MDLRQFALGRAAFWSHDRFRLRTCLPTFKRGAWVGRCGMSFSSGNALIRPRFLTSLMRSMGEDRHAKHRWKQLSDAGLRPLQVRTRIRPIGPKETPTKIDVPSDSSSLQNAVKNAVIT